MKGFTSPSDGGNKVKHNDAKMKQEIQNSKNQMNQILPKIMSQKAQIVEQIIQKN